MAEIKSIQRGTATIPDTTLNVTVAITTCDLTKSALFFGVSKATDERPARDYVNGLFSFSNELTFRRQAALGNAITIEWYVVEWDTGVTVQAGFHFGDEDTAVTAVVLADTFVWSTYQKGGNLQGNDDGVKAWLSTTTNLRMEDNDATLASVGVAWFLVESTDFVVQVGSLSMASGTTADQTITAVTLAEAFPIISFSTTGTAVLNTFALRGHFTSTTVLRLERDTDGSADPGTDGIRWQVVEVTDGSSVQSGTFVFADTDGQESATVTAVTEGLPIAAGHQGRGGQGSASEDGVNSAEVTLDLTTSTNLQADRGTTTGTADIEWFLIDWNAAAGGAQTIAVGVLAETDALVTIVPVKPIIVGVGVLVETDALVTVDLRQIIVEAVGVLGETDALIPISPEKVANIGTLSEADSLLAIDAVKPIITAVNVLAETDVLIPAPPVKVAKIGTLRSAPDYHVDLPGTTGHFVETPDHASLDITGDISLRWRGSLVDVTPTIEQERLIFKWTGAERAYGLEILGSGLVQFHWSTTGADQPSLASSVAIPYSNDEVFEVRADFDVDAGAADKEVTFFTRRPNEADWTQLGSVINQAGVATIFASTSPLFIGASDGGGFGALEGRLHLAQVYDGIGGSPTLVANFNGDDFAIGDSDTDTAVDSTGKTWTIRGANSAIMGAGPQPIQPRKIAVVGVLEETDALVSILALKPIIKVIGTASESETAQVVTPTQGNLIVVGTASELETAQAIIALKPIISAIGFASETEIAQAVNAIKAVTVGTPSETEVAQGVIPFKAVIIGTPTETEIAQVVAVVTPGGQSIAVGTPTETEIAQVVAPAKSVVMGFASEAEAAQAVIALKPIIQAVGTVAEIESAQGVAAIKPIITPVGTATEVESAQIVRYIKVLQIGTATETEVPITVTVIKIIVKLIGQALESEIAQIVAPGVSGLGDDGVLLTADDTGKAVAVVVVSRVAVLYDVVKIRS